MSLNLTALSGSLPASPALSAASFQEPLFVNPGLDGAQVVPSGAQALGVQQPSGPALDGSLPSLASPGSGIGTGSNGFEGALDFIRQAEAKEQTADRLETAYARGKNVPLHDVMAAAEEASIALETLATLRDRVLDAVNELTKMPL